MQGCDVATLADKICNATSHSSSTPSAPQRLPGSRTGPDAHPVRHAQVRQQVQHHLLRQGVNVRLWLRLRLWRRLGRPVPPAPLGTGSGAAAFGRRRGAPAGRRRSSPLRPLPQPERPVARLHARGPTLQQGRRETGGGEGVRSWCNIAVGEYCYRACWETG